MSKVFLSTISASAGLTSWYLVFVKELTPLLSFFTLILGSISGIMGIIYLYHQIKKIRRDLKKDTNDTK